LSYGIGVRQIYNKKTIRNTNMATTTTNARYWGRCYISFSYNTSSFL